MKQSLLVQTVPRRLSRLEIWQPSLAILAVRGTVSLNRH
jgi:hypothetical protein